MLHPQVYFVLLALGQTPTGAHLAPPLCSHLPQCRLKLVNLVKVHLGVHFQTSQNGCLTRENWLGSWIELGNLSLNLSKCCLQPFTRLQP